MNDANELYRQTKIAQARAEEHGFAGTAAALGGIAALLAREAGVDAEVIGRFAARMDAWPAPGRGHPAAHGIGARCSRR